jgi:hypothetical protein
VSFAKILSNCEINRLHSFLNPPVWYDCLPVLAKVAAFICTDPSGFNRAAFHHPFNRAVVAFQASVDSKRPPLTWIA